MNKAFILVLSFLSVIFIQYESYGQLQTGHWFFGQNAGLDFTSGTAIVDNTGQIVSPEGTSGFSDESGNLLFYTDGSTVYTRNHTIMPNGTDLFGHLSSTQSSIIIPAPDNPDLYYIFTTDAIENFLIAPAGSQSKGLNYSIVDMSLGTDGEVTIKNFPLPLSGLQRSNEQITAVAKADCSGYWVITHYLGKFYSFSVTAAGVDPNPAVTIAGPNSILTGVGALKASHDGKKLAFTSYSESGGLRMYDFNNDDGTLSNENILYMPPRQYYGVEFSPDNTILYASTANNLLQYNLNSVPILNSELVMATSLGNMSGTLQSGLDGKIYYANTTQFVDNKFLSVINNPNNFSSPGYVQDALFLGKKRAFGLPNFIPYLFDVKLFINNETDATEFCEEATLSFSYCHVNRNTVSSTVLWDFGDGNTSTDGEAVHSYTAPGTYTVVLTVTIGQKAYTSETEITINAAPEAENAEQKICIKAGEAHTFDLTQSYPQINPDNAVVSITFYSTEQQALDEENALSLNYSTAVSDNLWIRIENENGCYTIRQINLIVNQIPEISIQSPINICSGSTALLEVATEASNTVNWYGSSNANTPIFTGVDFETPNLTTDMKYWVEVVNPGGCISDRLEIDVEIINQLVPVFDLEQVYCLNSTPVQLPTVSQNGISGSWDIDSIDTSSIGTGTYTFTPDLGQCQAQPVRLQIQVIENVIPEFNFITEYFFEETLKRLPTVSDNGISGTWDVPYIDTTVSGTSNYSFIPDPDQCAEAVSVKIQVITYPRFFTPNGDGYNDLWNIWDLTLKYKPVIYIFDRYGKLIKQLLPLREGWDGTYNGNTLPATDYWFTVEFTINGEKREFRAHFTLKR